MKTITVNDGTWQRISHLRIDEKHESLDFTLNMLLNLYEEIKSTKMKKKAIVND